MAEEKIQIDPRVAELTRKMNENFARGGFDAEHTAAQAGVASYDYFRILFGDLKLFPKDKERAEADIDLVTTAIGQLPEDAKNFYKGALQRGSHRAYSEHQKVKKR